MKYSEQLNQDTPLFSELFTSANYQDDFGYSHKWNKEAEKWLFFVKTKNPDFYSNNIQRVKKDKQRDELLGEYKAAYFIEVEQEGEVLSFEPKGAVSNNGGKHLLDFHFNDKNGIEWFAEVKSPSWRGEIVKNIEYRCVQEMGKRMSPFFTSTIGRCQSVIPCPKCNQPVRIEVEESFLDIETSNAAMKEAKCKSCKKTIWQLSEPEREKLIQDHTRQGQFNRQPCSVSIKDTILDQVKNAKDKFLPNKNNLLIIVPNMLAPQVGLANDFDGEEVRSIVKQLDPNKLIKQILILEVGLGISGSFKYDSCLINIS